jgi:hypothetical protein
MRVTFMRVGHSRLEAVDFEPVVLEAEVAEHVVERAVLEHEDDDVVDLVERGDEVVDFDLDEPGQDLGPAAEEGPNQAHEAGDRCADGSHELAGQGSATPH